MLANVSAGSQHFQLHVRRIGAAARAPQMLTKAREQGPRNHRVILQGADHREGLAGHVFMLGGLGCLPNKIGVAAMARLMLRQAHGILLGGTKETLILGHGVRSTGQVTWHYEALHTITSTASRHGAA